MVVVVVVVSNAMRMAQMFQLLPRSRRLWFGVIPSPFQSQSQSQSQSPGAGMRAGMRAGMKTGRVSGLAILRWVGFVGRDRRKPRLEPHAAYWCRTCCLFHVRWDRQLGSIGFNRLVYLFVDAQVILKVDIVGN